MVGIRTPRMADKKREGLLVSKHFSLVIRKKYVYYITVASNNVPALLVVL